MEAHAKQNGFHAHIEEHGCFDAVYAGARDAVFSPIEKHVPALLYAMFVYVGTVEATAVDAVVHGALGADCDVGVSVKAEGGLVSGKLFAGFYVLVIVRGPVYAFNNCFPGISYREFFVVHVEVIGPEFFVFGRCDSHVRKVCFTEEIRRGDGESDAKVFAELGEILDVVEVIAGKDGVYPRGNSSGDGGLYVFDDFRGDAFSSYFVINVACAVEADT